MPRTPRIHVSDSWYHVFNRGARRQAVFFDSTDRRLFLELIAEVADRYGVEIHAYCLMGNHYHILIRAPEPNLGEVMQYLIGTYTTRFNTRHRFDGALFRGRYKAVLVATERYLVGVSRYIHRNPVDGGLTKNVDDYIWSSLPDYLGLRPAPHWLHTGVTLALAGGWQEYAAFVRASFRDIELDDFYGRARVPSVLGSPVHTALAEAS
ncbi:MAG: transposase [Actinomycetia bacterium]|nr:transposase [Actinomycetes bacterium]MCP4085877.1 transposase [Actinomycetes bacterium]